MTQAWQASTNYHAGAAAEDIVARTYTQAGHAIAARRWRGAGGEIDLIARDGAAVIFIEVKKGRTHAQAAQRVSHRQIARICATASEFVATEPRGQLTEMRFDLATVDQTGAVNILENAFSDM